MDENLTKKTAQLLSLLNTSSGYFIVSTDNCYCQFSKEKGENKIIFEVSSSYNIPDLELDESKLVSELGFILKEKENYSKEIIINSENDINYYTKRGCPNISFGFQY